MGDIIDTDLAAMLGNAEKALMISILSSTLAMGNNFYENNNFEGVYYCHYTAETWHNHFKWITLEKAQENLDDMLKSEWMFSFQTPQTTYYRPDFNKLNDLLRDYRSKIYE